MCTAPTQCQSKLLEQPGWICDLKGYQGMSALQEIRCFLRPWFPPFGDLSVHFNLMRLTTAVQENPVHWNNSHCFTEQPERNGSAHLCGQILLSVPFEFPTELWTILHWRLGKERPGCGGDNLTSLLANYSQILDNLETWVLFVTLFSCCSLHFPHFHCFSNKGWNRATPHP